MSMSDERAPDVPVDLVELPDAFVLTLADRVVVLSRSGKLLRQTLQVNVRADGNCQLLLAGLAPGVWSIRDRDSRVRFNTRGRPKQEHGLLRDSGRGIYRSARSHPRRSRVPRRTGLHARPVDGRWAESRSVKGWVKCSYVSIRPDLVANIPWISRNANTLKRTRCQFNDPILGP